MNVLNVVYTLRSFLFKGAVCFIILTYFVPVLFTFYKQDLQKVKKKSGAKRLICCCGSMSCVMYESYGVQLRPAVGVIVVLYSV
jgi:hypothetical protein